MAFPAGFNFRASVGFVTDTSPDVYIGDSGAPPTSQYPTTFSNGVTGGYENLGTFDVGSRDRSTTNPQLAGNQFAQTNNQQMRFDLSAAGSWNIQVASGDASYSTTCHIELFDTTTSLGILFNGSTGAANSFFDATGAILTAASWLAGTNGRGGVLTKTFSTTICRFLMDVTGGKLTHVYISAAGGGPGASDAAARRQVRPFRRGGPQGRFVAKQYDTAAPFSYPNLFTSEGTAALKTPGPHRGPPGRQFKAKGYAIPLSVSSDVTTAITGVVGTGNPGTVIPNIDYGLTTVLGTGAVGSVITNSSYAATGVVGTGGTGNVAANLSGALTGASATGGTGGNTPNITYALTGVQGTGQVGTVTPVTGTSLALTGVAATGQVGTAVANIDYGLAGAAGAGQTGNLTANLSNALAGVSATGGTGGNTPNVTYSLTGVQASGQVGSVTMTGGDVTIALTGVQAVGQVGSVSAPAPAPSTHRRGGVDEYQRRIKQSEDDLLLLMAAMLESGMFD